MFIDKNPWALYHSWPIFEATFHKALTKYVKYNDIEFLGNHFFILNCILFVILAMKNWKSPTKVLSICGSTTCNNVNHNIG